MVYCHSYSKVPLHPSQKHLNDPHKLGDELCFGLLMIHMDMKIG